MKIAQLVEGKALDDIGLDPFQLHVLARLDDLSLRLSQLEARLKPRERDPEQVSRILHAIVGKIGSHPFFVRDVYSSPILSKVCAGISRKQLGKCFRAIVDQPVDGLCIEEWTTVRRAIQWRIMKVVGM